MGSHAAHCLRCASHTSGHRLSVPLHTCRQAALQRAPRSPSLCFPAVAHLQQVLRSLPHLEAVEVEGLTPEAIGALLPAWQEALQQRGHEGCTIAGEGGALRFARVAE